MGCVGKATVVTKMGGRDSLVRLGDFVVPVRASWVFEGANGDPDAEVHFEVREGRPQCVEVSLKSKPNGRSVRTSDLGQLSLDAMTTSIYARSSQMAVYDPETNVTTMSPITDERAFWAAINATDAAVKAPRRGTTKAELEQVAKVYRDNVGGRPVEAVAAVMGYGSQRTAARRVEQARDAGLLPPTTPGKRKA